jgi:mRNA interferase MazF
MNTKIVVKRGDMFWTGLDPVVGSEQGGKRPVIVIQNDVGNTYSPTVIVAVITSRINKAKLPTHVEISSEAYGLNKDSVVLLEQIRTLDKRRLGNYIGTADDELLNKVDEAILTSLGVSKNNNKSTYKNERELVGVA